MGAGSEVNKCVSGGSRFTNLGLRQLVISLRDLLSANQLSHGKRHVRSVCRGCSAPQPGSHRCQTGNQVVIYGRRFLFFFNEWC